MARIIEHTQLAELTVGDQQGAEGAQTLDGLVAMLLSHLLVDRGTGNIDSLGVEFLSLPNEVLEQVALVLGQQKVLGLLDDIARVGN